MSIAISAKITDAAGAVSTAFASASLNTPSTITIGQTAILGNPDNGGDGGLLMAFQATLSQPATIQSLSFYVTAPAGKLRLGIYGSTGSNAGPLLAQTPEITPVLGWNTRNVITPVLLQPGIYWLCYHPSDNNLHFPYASGNGGNSRAAQIGYGALPATFPTVAKTPYSFSYYATLTSTASQQQTFTIALSTSTISGAPDGTTTGFGSFPANSLVTVTAVPNANLGFLNWADAGGNVLSTSQVYTFTLVKNMNLVANMNWVVSVKPPTLGGLIPADRITTWQPGVTYNGGIPTSYTQSGSTINPLGGSNDDTAAINAAIAGAADNTYVLLGTGTFRISAGGIRIARSNVILRGSGCGLGMSGGILANQIVSPVSPTTMTNSGTFTMLLKVDALTDADHAVVFMSNASVNDNNTATNLTSNGVKGTNTCTVASTSGLSIGDIVVVDMLSYPNYPDIDFAHAANDSNIRQSFSRQDRLIAQYLKITDINGLTLTFETSFHITMQTAFSAQLYNFNTPTLSGVGVEDLCVVMGQSSGIVMTRTDKCWIKHVDVYWTNGSAINMVGTYRSELRDSYIHEESSPVPGGGGYLITLDRGSENLFENNISIGGDKVIVMRCSCGGNVFAYNYCDDAFIHTFPHSAEAGINAAHMTTSHYELLEGNWTHEFKGDSYWGASNYITVHRNWLTARRTGRSYAGDGGGLTPKPWTVNISGTIYPFGDYEGRDAVDIQGGLVGGTKFANITGNVLGMSGQTLLSYSSATYNTTQTTWLYECLDGIVNFAANVCMWKIGDYQDPTPGHGDNQVWGALTYQTIMRQGNWDWFTQSQKWHGIGGSDLHGGNPSPPYPSIPNSFYLTSTPSFFGSNTWPWVDPYTGTTYTLPAKARYDAGTPNVVP